MAIFIALLRGINVGGNNMVPMADLRALFARCGFPGAVTHLQSGNVVFQAQGRTAEELEELLEASVREQFNLKIDFIVRLAQELMTVVEQNPLEKQALEDPSHVLVLFLKKPIDPKIIELQVTGNEGPEIVKPTPRHLYVYYAAGIADSKLGKVLKPGTPATGRNWNTVLKLVTIANSP